MLNDNEQLECLRAIVRPVCDAHGLQLVDARYSVEGGRVLRVLIERPGADPAEGAGVTLADCTDVSRQLSDVLEEPHTGLPDGAYRLEVGSPGLDRPLIALLDFERFAGRAAKLDTAEPIEGRRRFSGSLLGVEGDTVRFEQDGRAVEIPHPQITKAHLVHQF